MILRLEFGFNSHIEEINYYEDVMGYPKLIVYRGSVYEWVFYNKAPTGYSYEYVLNFSKTTLPSNLNINDIPVFEDEHKYTRRDDGCQCGAKYDKGNPKHHLSYCPQWRPKGK